MGRAGALAAVDPSRPCRSRAAGPSRFAARRRRRPRSAARESARTGRAQASSHIGPCPSKLVSVTPSTRAARASNTRPAALERGALMPRSHAARTIGSGTGTGHSTARLPAQRRGAAPGRAAGLVAPGQAEAAQAGTTLPGARPADEGLAAPQRAVRAVAHAVPGEHDRGLRDAVLGDECRRMGVVVQHGAPGLAERLHPARRRVAGVRVAEPARGPHVVEALQVAHHLLEHLLAAQRAHVAHVRRHDHAAAPGQRHGELQVPAHGQHRLRQLGRQLELERRQAATEADRPRPAGCDAHHRVVGRADDRAVVVQEGVGHGGEPRLDLRRIGEHRLAAHVARGRHHRPAERGEQQVMQRAVGQEGADLAEAGRHGRREAAVGAPRHEHDRARRVEERRLLDRTDVEFLASRGEPVVAALREHHGERLVRPSLALAQPPHGGLVARVAQQVVAADAAHREHAARRAARRPPPPPPPRRP